MSTDESDTDSTPHAEPAVDPEALADSEPTEETESGRARRKEALRALVMRESATDWLAFRGGTMASDAATTAAERSKKKKKRPKQTGTSRGKRSEVDGEPSERSKISSRRAVRQAAKEERKQERERLLSAWSEARSDGHSREDVPRALEEENPEKVELEDALVNAWGDTARRDQEGRTRRHGPAQPAEPLAPPAGAGPDEVQAQGTEKAAESIPRAARPASDRLPALEWKPAPRSDSATDPVSTRLKIIIAALAVGILYLGISGGIAQSKLEHELATLKKHEDVVLQTEQTRSQRILTSQGKQITALEKRQADAAARLAKLRTDHEEAVERGDRLEHELAEAHSEAKRSKAERARLEASLGREQQARAEGEATRGKLDIQISELEALRTRLEAQVKDLGERAAGREQTLTQLREEFAGATRRLEEALAAAKELSAERDQAMASAEELNQELTASSEARAALTAAVRRLEAELTGARAALKTRGEELAAARAASEERSATLAALRRERDEQATQLLALRPREVPLSLVFLEGERRAGDAAGSIALADQRALLDPPGDANRLFEAARKGEVVLALRLQAEGTCAVGVLRGERTAPVGEAQPLTPSAGLFLIDAAAVGSAGDTTFVVSSAGEATVHGATLVALPLGK